MMTTKIGIIGDYNPEYPLHPATTAAVQHAAAALAETIEATWLATDRPHPYEEFHGFWCSPGSPYRDLDGALRAVRYARENQIPFLGTCGGFQHAVLEYARNVMGLQDAAHAEYDPYASRLFVTRLSCSLVGKTMAITLQPGSKAAAVCRSGQIDEAFYCNFGLNPDYQDQLRAAGLQITGRDQNREARIAELTSHPYFVATLFVPQARSAPGTPHPLIVEFCRAAVLRRQDQAELAGSSPRPI
jgi:CTP synthase (UTP-ammonia lyase)